MGDTLVATLLSRLQGAHARWPDAGLFDARGGILGRCGKEGVYVWVGVCMGLVYV